MNAPVQIRHLVQQLSAIYKNCRANNTIKKYRQYFNARRKWATDLNVSFLPGNPFHIGLYILHKMQAGHSLPTIDATFFAIKFYHTSLLNTDPCQHSLVKNMFEVAKQLSNHKTKKKQALRPNELKQIYDYLSANQSSLENLRLLNICLTAFTGFMRFSAVISIKGFDIIFTETYMKDIYREGAWVYISRSHNMCPVKHLEDYLRLVNINISSCQFIFRGKKVTTTHSISKGKKSRLRRKNKPISYTTIRQNLLKVIKAVRLNWKDYGLHSLRAGGASLAANKGILDRLFKRHGQWKCDRAKDGYVEDTLKMLLSVSKNL